MQTPFTKAISAILGISIFASLTMEYFIIFIIPAIVLGLIGGGVYLYLTPKPHPTVPYNTESAVQLWGDIPQLLAHHRRTGEVASFGWEQCRKLGSPIVQLFLKPGGRMPFLWLDDARETEDILLRRSREFDRAPSTSAIFRPLIPHATIVKQTGADFKRQRRLWHDAMSPNFLRTVVASSVGTAVGELIELWKLKSLCYKGPSGEHLSFSALQDLELATFDAIWVSILGSRPGCMRAEINAIHSNLKNLKSDETNDSKKDPFVVDVPSGKRPEIYQAIVYMNGSVERIIGTPWPTLYHWFIRQTPQYKHFSGITDREIRKLMSNARERYSRLSSGELNFGEKDTCAMDLVLRREAAAMLKGSAGMTKTEELEMQDELLMLLVAGHETTAVTLGWAVKLLASNQATQAHLRKYLRSAFPDSSSSSQPNVSDILNANIPYLDAVLEEVLRLSNTVPLLVRVATVDTTVLGHQISAGTHIGMNAQFSTQYDVSEALRSQSCQAAWVKAGARTFVDSDLSSFWPERWIDDQGKFNPKALTKLAFSLGQRGCFGQKMAMLELRIMLATLVLAFDFRPVPDGLSSSLGKQRILRAPRQCFVNLIPL